MNDFIDLSLEGPSVKPEQIDKLIEDSTIEYAYFDNTMTIVVVKLPCGFKVTGQTSCVDPANFNKTRGEKYALENARYKLCELEGYLLANKIHEEKIRSCQGDQ